MEIKTKYEMDDELYYMSSGGIKKMVCRGIDIRVRRPGCANNGKPVHIEYISQKTGEGHYEETVAKTPEELFKNPQIKDE